MPGSFWLLLLLISLHQPCTRTIQLVYLLVVQSTAKACKTNIIDLRCFCRLDTCMRKTYSYSTRTSWLYRSVIPNYMCIEIKCTKRRYYGYALWGHTNEQTSMIQNDSHFETIAPCDNTQRIQAGDSSRVNVMYTLVFEMVEIESCIPAHLQLFETCDLYVRFVCV